MEGQGRGERSKKPWVARRGLESAEGSSQVAGAPPDQLWLQHTSGYQSLEEKRRAALACVPEPWPCTAGQAGTPSLAVVWDVCLKSLVSGNRLPGCDPSSTLTSHASLGKGCNSSRRLEQLK